MTFDKSYVLVININIPSQEDHNPHVTKNLDSHLTPTLIIIVRIQSLTCSIASHNPPKWIRFWVPSCQNNL